MSAFQQSILAAHLFALGPLSILLVKFALIFIPRHCPDTDPRNAFGPFVDEQNVTTVQNN